MNDTAPQAVMSELHGYETVEQVVINTTFVLFRVRRLTDGRTLLLKQATGSLAAPLRKEYGLLQSLTHAGLIKPVELIEERGHSAMLLEDFAGQSFEATLTGVPLDWPAAAIIGAKLAEALAGLHEAQLTHQDLRPANLLLDPGTGRVCLIDFTLATPRRQNEIATENEQLRVGDWAYIAPEQTGRANHPIDARTDLYSLGLILYRMLTGRLPFQAHDPVEWAHCHIARIPAEPATLVRGIPQPVCALVMRLLAKAPQDRYQSARGLIADIQQCLEQWRSSAQIQPFALGQADFPDQLRIPRKLYGRDTQIALLLEIFERVSAAGQPELITLTGSSGSGKSCLVHEVRAPIERRGGHFIAGKFDQYQRDIPYATLAHAFRDLTRQLFAAGEGHINQWRQDIEAAVGTDGRILTEVLPEIQLIIGPQPEVPRLPPTEQQHRLRAVFQRFIMVFCRRRHPLTLFLDDAQWIDAASLELIGSVMSHPDTRNLLLLLAFRANELPAEHPLLQRLAAIASLGLRITEIEVQPLPAAQLNQLVADTLGVESSSCESLTQLILRRTVGNPFFFVQFLRSLHQEGLLRRQPEGHSWTWQLSEIETRDFAADAVDLIIGRLQRLPVETQRILQVAACLGNRFEWHTLALASSLSEPQVHTHLAAAAHAGLIAQSAEAGRFLHDRIQQAAYALLAEGDRPAMHLKIGRALAAHPAPEWIDTRLFEIVNQLDRGAALVQSPPERQGIAALNVRAGNRAKQSAAYSAALNYFATAEELLGETRWAERPGDAFELALLRAKCEFLTADLESAEEHLSTLTTRAGNLIEQAAITSLRLDLYSNTNRIDRAVEVALDYLRRIGIEWSPRPSDAQVNAEYAQLQQRIGNRSLEDLIEAAPVRDPHWEATLSVLAGMLRAAVHTDYNLWCVTVLRFVSLSVEHGNSEASPWGYVCLARIVGSRFGEHGRAYRLGQLACDMVDRYGVNHFSARVYLSFAACVSGWAQPIQVGRVLTRRAFDMGVRLGDLTFMGYCYSHTIATLLANGDPLSEAQIEAERGLAFARKARFTALIDSMTPLQQLVRTLRGLTIAFGSFNDTDFDESRFEEKLRQDPRLATAASAYWLRKLQARLLAGEHASALEAAMRMQPLLWTSRALHETADYHLFAALARAKSVEDAPPGARHRQLQEITAHYEELRRWALECPENFQDRAELVGAEHARLQGREADAIQGYEQAARSARERGFVQIEALANELEARYFLSRGSATAAQGPLEAAHSAYTQWGATGKVKQLEEQFPQLRAHTTSAEKSWSPLSSTGLQGLTQLDVVTVTKASQAISGKIVFEELIDTLMRIVLESAGARTGSLLLRRGDTLVPAAEADALQETVRVRLHPHTQPGDCLVPASIVNYVYRSRSVVLLGDATERNPFMADPYFAERQTRSVLCLPILRQAELIGILYMENDLLAYTFTPERVSVLELLTVQIAISIGSAQLYDDLRQENQERRRAEQALREQEGRIRRLVESNIIGIFFWTFAGEITAANDALLQMVGYSRADLLNGTVSWIVLTPEEYREADLQKLQNLRENGVCPPYEKEYIHKDGHRIPVLIGATGFEDSSEAGVAFVLDLSERKQAEADRHARQLAEAANRAKSDFLARMSHELRTPLNAILGYAQILQKDTGLSERHRQRATIIQHSGEHLLQLIDDILDLAKIEAGKLELNRSVFALAPFLQLLADIVGIKAGQKGLSFVCDAAPDLPAYIWTDERRLLQVLLNLSSNAVKFTDRGEVRIEISSHGAGRLRFAVHDSGTGIPADRLEMIFQPFAQVGVERHGNSGTGLGLNISRQLVQLMGSEIHARSTVGRGSSFWFELELPVVASVPSTRHPAAPVRNYEGRRRKVLIIDDDRPSRIMLTDWLRSLGFMLFEVASGTLGIERARNIEPDVVLTDLAMPELDGFETIRRLRALPNFQDVPIIAISAGLSEYDAERSLGAGANAFLMKPVSLSQLQVHLTALLDIRWIYEEGSPTLLDEHITTPPSAVLGRLRQLAQEGNMRELAREAAHIASLDPRYGPFSKRVQSLASAYETRAVLSLIESAN